MGTSLLAKLLMLGTPKPPPEKPEPRPVRFLDVPSRENDADRGWRPR